MDVNTFLLMVIYILGVVLLVTLIILVIKLINTVDRLNGIVEEAKVKLDKFDKAFRFVDLFTDNMALISDKVVDGISYVIRRMFSKKDKRKEEDMDEQS